MPEGATSASSIYRARPSLRFNGAEDPKAAESLLAMRFEEQEGGLASMELRFVNWAATDGGGAGYAFEGSSNLALGAEIEIYVGDETQPRELFKGKISALEGHFPMGSPPELVLLAEDAMQGLRLTRKSRTFTDMAPADIASAIAGDHGLTPVVAGLDAGSGTWVQFNETDLGFLRRLLFRFDADLQVVGSELQVSPRGDVQRGRVELALGGQLFSARVCADLAQQVSSVSAQGWDASAGSKVTASISSGAHLGPGAGSTGAALLQDKFGARNEHLGQLSAESDAEVNALAQASFDGRARRFVVVDAIAEGNALLRIGTEVKLTGLTAAFNNSYYLVLTRHLYDQRLGFRSEFRGECAYLGA